MHSNIFSRFSHFEKEQIHILTDSFYCNIIVLSIYIRDVTTCFKGKVENNLYVVEWNLNTIYLFDLSKLDFLKNFSEVISI